MVFAAGEFMTVQDLLRLLVVRHYDGNSHYSLLLRGDNSHHVLLLRGDNSHHVLLLRVDNAHCAQLLRVDNTLLLSMKNSPETHVHILQGWDI